MSRNFKPIAGIKYSLTNIKFHQLIHLLSATSILNAKKNWPPLDIIHPSLGIPQFIRLITIIIRNTRDKCYLIWNYRLLPVESRLSLLFSPPRNPHFMHPDDISGSFDTAFTQPIPVSHQPTQHGFPAPNPNPSLRGCAARLNVTEVGTPPSDGRNESPSKKDAVRKYEAKWASPRGDTAFRVKKTDWDGRKDSPISRFPNGMSNPSNHS